MSDIASQFVERVKLTDLPLDKVIVVGSGVLALHGLRPAGDVDCIVDPLVFEELEKNVGWSKGREGSSSYALEKGDVEIWTDWSTDGTGHPTYEDLLSKTELVEGIRCVTLEYLKQKKLERGTEKDMEDVETIDDYRSRK